MRAHEAGEVRIGDVATRALALRDDGRDGLLCGLQVDHGNDAGKRRERGIDLARRLAREEGRFADRGGTGVERIGQNRIELADRRVVARARRQAALGYDAPIVALRRKRRGIGQCCLVLRALEKLEVLDGLGAEGLQPDDEAGRIRPGIDREGRPGRGQRAAERVGQITDEREVRHLLEHHRHDGVAPALHRVALLVAPARLDPLEAERGVEVAAHQVMLDLGRLVQPVQQLFASRHVGARLGHGRRCSGGGTSANPSHDRAAALGSTAGASPNGQVAPLTGPAGASRRQAD